MTYAQLKEFCNSLTEEQLQQDVYLSEVDGAAYQVDNGCVTDEDHYFDHVDDLGTLEEIKQQYPDEWEDVIDGATKVPKGTVVLIHE